MEAIGLNAVLAGRLSPIRVEPVANTAFARRAEEAPSGDAETHETEATGIVREEDRVELSDEARAADAERDGVEPQLTESEQEEVDELKKRDREVREHEAAHKAAAGAYARGGPVYEYERGPDGSRYAVGGHVSIDTSEVKDDPEATLRKMAVVRRAALAPGEPSSQDRRVAAAADRKAQKARAEMAETKPDSAADPSAPEELSPAEATANIDGAASAETADRTNAIGAVADQAYEAIGAPGAIGPVGEQLDIAA